MIYLRSLDDQIIIQVEEGQNLLVGRLPKCDIVLEDGSVSSQHARIQLMEDKLRVVDMGSTNGTRVNYAAIEDPVYLLDGDTVEFGNVTFTIDGGSLISPASESTAMQAIVDLDPIEASQQMSDTMLSIPLPDEGELEEMIQASGQAAAEAQGLGDPDAEKEEPPLEPESISFRIALGLLLVGGCALLMLLWFRPDTF